MPEWGRWGTLTAKVFWGAIGFLDGVSCAKDLAIGGADDKIDEVFAEELAGVLVEERGFVDEEREFHDAIAEDVVEKEGDGESLVDSEGFEELRWCIFGHRVVYYLRKNDIGRVRLSELLIYKYIQYWRYRRTVIFLSESRVNRVLVEI